MSVIPKAKYVTFYRLIVMHNNSLLLLYMYIATYHVQELTLQYYSDNVSVVVECSFAERSTADGCHAIFRDSSTLYQYMTLPVCGNFTLTAHDIVDSTIITNPSVVYSQVLEYIYYYHLILRLLLLLVITNKYFFYIIIYHYRHNIK